MVGDKSGLSVCYFNRELEMRAYTISFVKMSYGYCIDNVIDINLSGGNRDTESCSNECVMIGIIHALTEVQRAYEYRTDRSTYAQIS